MMMSVLSLSEDSVYVQSTHIVRAYRFDDHRRRWPWLAASGKRVVLFAVPGAFTTCSFPPAGLRGLARQFKAKGVGFVLSCPINLTFVMKA